MTFCVIIGVLCLLWNAKICDFCHVIYMIWEDGEWDFLYYLSDL